MPTNPAPIEMTATKFMQILSSYSERFHSLHADPPELNTFEGWNALYQSFVQSERAKHMESSNANNLPR